MLKVAVLWRTHDENKVHCYLCNHHCKIPSSRFGICGMRQNMNGTLYTHAYGEVVAANVDPIEKKPLYHFLPGTKSLSIATMGCNFRCGFCQNWRISQVSRKKGTVSPGREFSPEDIVQKAKDHNCQSISYTYTEPTIFFEYAYDTARLAIKQGLFNLFVTNGFMTSEALWTIRPYLHACNVDLKSFREDFYKKICRGRLQPVLDSIRLMKTLNMWVEITTLIVPDVNDGEDELTSIARFIAEIDPDIPWHVSRFHPDYEFIDSQVTPLEVLNKVYSLGKKEGLRYVYIGNVPGKSADTVCPNCRETILRRRGYSIEQNCLENSHCPQCGHLIAGVFGAQGTAARV